MDFFLNFHRVSYERKCVLCMEKFMHKFKNTYPIVKNRGNVKPQKFQKNSKYKLN